MTSLPGARAPTDRNHRPRPQRRARPALAPCPLACSPAWLRLP